MIYVDAGQRNDQSFEARLIFAQSLRQAGIAAALDDRTLPDDLNRNHKYDLATLAVTSATVPPSGAILLLGAGDVSDATLSTLRGYALGPDRPVMALGRFDTRQARLGAGARLAYAIGREPELLDLAELQPDPLIAGAMAPLLAARDPSRGADTGSAPTQCRPRVLVVLPGELAEDPDNAAALTELGANRQISAGLVTSANGKTAVAARLNGPGTPGPVFAYGELPPATLAERADIVVVLGAGSPGMRIGQLCAELLAAGGVVIDGTDTASLMAAGAPIVRGPTMLAALPGFFEHEILPQLAAIRAEVLATPWTRRNRLDPLIARLRAVCAPATHRHAAQGIPPPSRAPQTVFLPTNGVGLGHAQRCALIAQDIPASEPVSFAAFPSCVELITRRGFTCRPLVQKSSEHADPFANDIVNYRRLSRWLAPGDRLVFDGVFVFDSIYRTIQEHDLDAVWIRRGLWRAQQTNTAALGREHAFRQVIVPEEAFDELNQHYSFGAHIRHVGPIVQQSHAGAAQVRATRKAIARQFGRGFDRLVVSMLGGGVAADRGPQLQTLAALIEARTDTLHLVVVWPGAQIAPGMMLWKNTRVVRSLEALSLAQAADLVVSAVGYNSFHEILYHRIPTLFIPQTAPYMDDQERRARAAADRGLAEIVLPEDLVMLQRRVGALLAEGGTDALRRSLADVVLPRPGNAAAAAHIAGEPDETRRLA